MSSAKCTTIAAIFKYTSVSHLATLSSWDAQMEPVKNRGECAGAGWSSCPLDVAVWHSVSTAQISSDSVVEAERLQSALQKHHLQHCLECIWSEGFCLLQVYWVKIYSWFLVKDTLWLITAPQHNILPLLCVCISWILCNGRIIWCQWSITMSISRHFQVNFTPQRSELVQQK